MHLSHKNITNQIISKAFLVYNTLGDDFLEKVYQNAFAHEIKLMGFNVKTEVPIDVYYNNVIVGKYFADILVNDSIILEIKCSERISGIHLRQVRHYLKATNLDTAFIFNFKGPSVDFCRVFLDKQ